MDLDFKERYVLENERALLRPLEPADKALLSGFALTEPGLWRFNANGGGGKEHFDRYFENAIAMFREQQQYPFIIFDKRSNAYAGMTRFYEIANEFRRLEIGYTWYGKDYQGTGLNKNCKYLLLEFAFEQLQMIRVGFCANSKNERSINAMKSIGCQVEGISRQYSKDAAGNVTDLIRQSILKSEWESGVKERLGRRLGK